MNRKPKILVCCTSVLLVAVAGAAAIYGIQIPYDEQSTHTKTTYTVSKDAETQTNEVISKIARKSEEVTNATSRIIASATPRAETSAAATSVPVSAAPEETTTTAIPKTEAETTTTTTVKPEESAETTTTTVTSSALPEEIIPTTYMKGNRQALKFSPEGLTSEDLHFEYNYDENGYYFPSSGISITYDDYYILCNCVALEYGANWVPEWEMALVCEVVFNRFHNWGYSSIRAVITAPNQFEGSPSYAGLDGYSSRVNSRVINAVNTYLAFPQYFNEGYTYFNGDGTWNYFR